MYLRGFFDDNLTPSNRASSPAPRTISPPEGCHGIQRTHFLLHFDACSSGLQIILPHAIGLARTNRKITTTHHRYRELRLISDSAAFITAAQLHFSHRHLPASTTFSGWFWTAASSCSTPLPSICCKLSQFSLAASFRRWWFLLATFYFA